MAYKQKKSPMKILPILPLAFALGEKTGVTDFITTDKEEEEQEAMEDKLEAISEKVQVNTKISNAANAMYKHKPSKKGSNGFFASDDYGKSTSDPNAKLKSVYRMKGNPMKRNFPKYIKK